MGHARINGTVRVSFKTRLIFPRINGPIVNQNMKAVRTLTYSYPNETLLLS